MENSNKILLIDVSNLLFRCYYVFKNLSNKKGQKTGAIYGFLNMLLFYKEKTGISNMILCWDSPSETNWRLAIYPEYKENRRLGTDGDPEKLKKMIEVLLKRKKHPENEKKLVKKLEKLIVLKDIVFAKDKIWNITNKSGFINVYKPQFEADDLIAMLTKKLKKNIRILSCDKDLLQLIDDFKNIKVYKPMMGHGTSLNKSYTIYNEKKVFEEYGIYPKDFHHILAITGDGTDNVEGVRGFAYKRAVKLFNEKNGDIKKGLDEDNYKIYERNILLVGLHSLPGELSKNDFGEGILDTKGAQKILDNLEIRKFNSKQLKKLNNPEFKENLIERF